MSQFGTDVIDFRLVSFSFSFISLLPPSDVFFFSILAYLNRVSFCLYLLIYPARGAA